MRIKRLLLILLLLIPIKAYSLEYPKVNSKIIEIYDLNDKQILYEVKANDTVSIASLTKVATALVAIENVKDLNTKVTITQNILNTVSPEAHVAGLRRGDIVTYKDLLYATIVTSGADAANALAILSSGSLSNHVNKMNDLAKKIGLEHTSFKNVTGLDATGSYSTADDVRKLLYYALDNSLFKEIYTTKKYTLSNGLIVNTTLKLYDKNGAVDTSFIIGSKTGFTNKAGYCLAYLVDINGHNMLIVTLNAERRGNNYYNLIDAGSIVKFMNNNYKEEVLVKKNEIIKELPVKLSNKESYSIQAKSDIKKYLPSDYDKNNLKIEYEGLNELSFKNSENEKIGIVSYYYGDELLLKEDVILKEEISINIVKVLKTYYWQLLIVILIITLLVVILKKKMKRKRN